LPHAAHGAGGGRGPIRTPLTRGGIGEPVPNGSHTREPKRPRTVTTGPPRDIARSRRVREVRGGRERGQPAAWMGRRSRPLLRRRNPLRGEEPCEPLTDTPAASEDGGSVRRARGHWPSPKSETR